MTAGADRDRGVDVAKGLAFVGVVLIHSGLLMGDGSGAVAAFHRLVINRSVPVFLVLFGLTSAWWWESASRDGRASASSWLRSRLGRLLPPYWTAVLAWWTAQRLLAREPLGIDVLAAGLACYLPAGGMGTTWFVTVVVQLVLLDPWLRRASRALGGVASAVVAVGLLVGAHIWALDLLAFLEPRLPLAGYVGPLWAFWILVPPYFALLLAGHAVAIHGPHRTRSGVVAAAVAWSVAALVSEVTPPGSAESRIASALGDIPLAILFLAAASRLSAWPRLGAALSWVGRRSWEAYLGHAVTFALAGGAFLRMAGVPGARLAWTLLLVAGGVAYALLWQAVERRRAAR